ncbi:MAG: M50 family metallopeptidase [Chloroflexota bacterium]
MSNNFGVGRTSRWQMLLVAVGAFVLVYVLWQFVDSPLLYPFRLLVTFVHETGHGLTAVITGGRFENFVVFDNGSGVATTRGGNPFFVIQMGYLGAALFGATLLYTANRTHHIKALTVGLAVFFLGCAIFYTGSGFNALIGAVVIAVCWILALRSERWRTPLRIVALIAVVITLILVHSNNALMIGLIAGVVLLLLAAYASPIVLSAALTGLAFITGLNAINDVRFLLGNQSAALQGTPNDALAMAMYTNTPTVLWIGLWIALAVIVMVAALYWAFIRR